MNGSNWLDDEPKAGVFVRQAVTLVGRGFLRPFLSLLVAVLFAGAVYSFLRFGKHDYAPRLVLRLVEAEGDARSVARTKRQLATYVREGVFTSGPLLEIIRRHGLYPTLARNNPRVAVETFREDIAVEAYRNYFIEERSAHDGPRTARVALGFRSDDPARALAVTRDLGALVVERERSARREQAQRAAAEARLVRDVAKSTYLRRAGEIAVKEREIRAASEVDPVLAVEFVGLVGSLDALERETQAATRRAAELELGASLERAGVGLHFELAEDATLPSPSQRARARLFATGLSFLFGLPLAAAAIAAFDDRRRA